MKLKKSESENQASTTMKVASNLSQSCFVIIATILFLNLSQSSILCASVGHHNVTAKMAAAPQQGSAEVMAAATASPTISLTTNSPTALLIPPATVEPEIHLVRKEEALE